MRKVLTMISDKCALEHSYHLQRAHRVHIEREARHERRMAGKH